MSPETKVDAINDAFRQRILDGEFGTAGRLPSLRMLAEQFDTTHETMNKVIQRLQAEGLLISLGRAGVFVRHAGKRIPGITPRFDRYLESMGLTAIETYIDGPPDVIAASKEVAEALDVAEGTPVVHRFRRQGTPQAHYRLAENFYPTTLIDSDALEQMKRDEHFDVLLSIRERHQQIIRSVHEDVIARLPTSQEQDLLKIVRNTPVFEILRTSYADEEDGPAIMYSRIISVASLFILSYDYSVAYWQNT